MIRQNQLRQTFTRHWSQSCETGKNAWLIKGDFDHFKWTNDLYGSLISDYLLDWSLEVIEAELQIQQKRWGCEDLLCNFTGDDVTIYISPSILAEKEIEQFLRKLRCAVAESFSRRYMIGALPLSAEFFEDIPQGRLKNLRAELEGLDVVFDFDRRERGYLVLFPVGAGGAYKPSFDTALRVIQRCTGKAVPAVEPLFDWIYNPENKTRLVFNNGFINPPLISFAACAVPMGMASAMPHDSAAVFERAAFACQSALKACKQQRRGVMVRKEALGPEDMAQAPEPSENAVLDSPLRWSSERNLRESLYFQQLDRPVLFQFNPVYLPACETLANAIRGNAQKIEEFRGNRYGVGLKGVNELFGHKAADTLIVQIISIFSKVMQGALVAKGIPADDMYIAQFVDRFTVCCKQSIFQPADTAALVGSVGRLFNSVSDEIKITHLRASVVLGAQPLVGYRLFHQLSLTGLSTRATLLENPYPPVEMRQNDSSAVLHEGSTALERRSCASAKLLASSSGALLQTKTTQAANIFSVLADL